MPEINSEQLSDLEKHAGLYVTDSITDARSPSDHTGMESICSQIQFNRNESVEFEQQNLNTTHKNYYSQ